MIFRFKWFYTALLWTSFAAVASACSPPPPPANITPTPAVASFRLGVDTSAANLVALVARPLQQETDIPELRVMAANQETLFAALESDQVDAILTHAVPPGEDYWFNPVALDGLVFILNPDTLIEDLSRAELQAIFAGDLTNWSELGGPDLPIVVVSRERGASGRRLLGERVLAERRLVEGARIVADEAAALRLVRSESGAIGYTMLGMVDPTGNVAVDGIRPDPATVADQSYPLTVPLYFVSHQEPQGQLRLFLAWLQSEQGQGRLGENYGRIR